MATALVRDVSPHLDAAELTFLDRTPLDVGLAVRQHDAYVQVLTGLGLDVVRLPAAPELPDGCFVEDVLVVVDDLAVLTRPGAASRRPEVDSAVEAVERLGLRTVRIAEPATLDGGDVLQIGRDVFVGLGTRTNAAAVDQLRELLDPLGRRVVPVAVTGCLHLKTGATALPDGTVVAVPEWLDVAAFGDREVLAVPEPAGADLLLVGEDVVLSASAPLTAELVRSRGFRARPVELSELERAEAGPTCLSVLVPTDR